MCEEKEVTKISLVPLDSCAHTSDELIIPSAKNTLFFVVIRVSILNLVNGSLF